MRLSPVSLRLARRARYEALRLGMKEPIWEVMKQKTIDELRSGWKMHLFLQMGSYVGNHW